MRCCGDGFWGKSESVLKIGLVDWGLWDGGRYLVGACSGMVWWGNVLGVVGR